MINNNPTYGGPGKRRQQFKTRMPVGKNYGGVPRLGQKLNIPIFGNRPKPPQQVKALTPSFRGPANLPSNFIKNIPGLGIKQSPSSRAAIYNGPLKRSVRRKNKKTPKK